MEAATMLHLWEITEAEQELAERLVEADGEITPELEAEWDRISGLFDEKVERTALYIRQLEANAKAAAEEEQRLAQIRRTLQRKADGLKGYLQFQMTKSGRGKVETPRARVWVQKNGRPSIRYAGDASALPDDFKRVTVAVDGDVAYRAWKDGRELPDGFVVDHGSHLRIA